MPPYAPELIVCMAKRWRMKKKKKRIVATYTLQRTALKGKKTMPPYPPELSLSIGIGLPCMGLRFLCAIHWDL